MVTGVGLPSTVMVTCSPEWLVLVRVSRACNFWPPPPDLQRTWKETQVFTWNPAAAPDERRPFRHAHIYGAGVGVIDPTTVVEVEGGVEAQCARGGNLGSHVKDEPAIGLEAGSGVEHEQNDLVDVRRRAGPADDEYVTLGINPHVRGLIEALDTGLAVDIRPKQRPSGRIAFYSEKLIVEI